MTGAGGKPVSELRKELGANVFWVEAQNDGGERRTAILVWRLVSMVFMDSANYHIQSIAAS